MTTTAAQGSADLITILSCRRPLVMTKVWRADGSVQPYSKAKRFSMRTETLGCIEDLSMLLTALEGAPQSCVIRGAYSATSAAEVLRRKDQFEDRPHHWFLVEVDGFPTEDIDPVLEPEAAALAFVRAHLPEAFQDVSFHWQLSSSTGRPEKRGKLYVHLWFWSDAELDSAALKRWAKQFRTSVDPSVFDPIQVHYTAAPIFEAGVSNPVPRRSGLHRGLRRAVALEIPPEPEKSRSRSAFGSSPAGHFTLPQAGELDARGQWLEASWRTFGRRENGGLIIACPFEGEHGSGETGDTSTVYFPASPGGSARGAFKCFHNACSERALEDFDAALEFDPPEVLNPADLHAVASYLLSSRFTLDGERTLVRYQGEWLEFERSHYINRTDEEIRTAAWEVLSKARKRDKFGRYVPMHPSFNQISAALDALKAVAAMGSLSRGGGGAPQERVWLDGRLEPDPRNLIVLNNGILDLTTRVLSPHSPQLFSRNALPYAWTEDAPDPLAFLKFLDEVFDGDQEQIGVLQEVFGHLVSPSTSPQKITLILGPRRSGKGTIVRLLKQLVGPLNVASPTLQTLSESFGLQPLLGKTVAILSDVRNASHRSSESALQNLLMISGQDSVTVNRKNLPAWTGDLPVRFLMTANELPRLTDSSDAMLARLLVLKMPLSFEGREDPQLTERLLRDLPGILTWALDGLDRLRARGRFVQPAAGREPLESYRRLNNPIQAFLDECCVIEAEASTLLDDLYLTYRSWMSGEGRQPVAKERFSSSLVELGEGLERRRPRVEGRQRTSIYGLRLADQISDLGVGV
jgi:putative DNA primase/helicase